MALGAEWINDRARFALFAPQAQMVELCLFDEANGVEETERINLARTASGVWQTITTRTRPGQLYGYRVYGPCKPERGLRFNPHKLLLDPYAKTIVGQVVRHETTYGLRRESSGSLDEIDDPLLGLAGVAPVRAPVIDHQDSGPWVPKSMLIDPAFDWDGDQRPGIAWRDTVIYECHVKGMTQLHPDVPPELRGTYLGLTAPAVVDHLRQLGVTTVELLPVHHALDRERLTRLGLTNYWGYDTIGFFAPDARWAASPRGGQVNEFKTLVRELHRAGFEIILDVVYNHTPEGDHLGPTLCFRGIDNAEYYLLDPADLGSYLDFTGCGNTFNGVSPAGLGLIIDSLRYWVKEMHVDGFRFDLATAMLRTPHGLAWTEGFTAAIQSDPLLADVKLIVEPWDAAAGGYQVGRFPKPFVEWNDKFRDGVRRFWIGTAGHTGELASRISGSSNLFADSHRGPLAGINFVTSHDGFTLADLCTYERKHNLANGEKNADGMEQNFSRDWGHEGPGSDPVVFQRRDQAARNLLATLALSVGVPMITAGDEIGRTQQGNNNAYCQDNAVSWLDWNIGPRQRSMLQFARRALQLRRGYHAFRREQFFEGRPVDGSDIKDLTWLREDGSEMLPEDWTAPDRKCLGMLLAEGRSDPAVHSGDAAADSIGSEKTRAQLLLMSAMDQPVMFKLPHLPMSGTWTVVLDSANPVERSAPLAEEFVVLASYHLILLEYQIA